MMADPLESLPDAEIVERGAETIRMPEGDGYAISTWDEVRPDRIVRFVVLSHVQADPNVKEEELHEHSEVIYRNPEQP